MKKVIEDFWIRCYLGSTNGTDLIKLSISRAYRDLNRTIHGMKNVEFEKSKNNYATLSEKVRNSALVLLNTQFKNQAEFDLEHEKQCHELMYVFDKLYSSENLIFHVGQSQKWINMTLKYLYALGKERHQLSLDNYKYFHIPIDNIIQEELNKKHTIKPLNSKWSRIETYQEYIDYQIKVRDKFEGKIPMDVEFELFNM
jgi:hypothetical protein